MLYGPFIEKSAIVWFIAEPSAIPATPRSQYLICQKSCQIHLTDEQNIALRYLYLKKW